MKIISDSEESNNGLKKNGMENDRCYFMLRVREGWESDSKKELEASGAGTFSAGISGTKALGQAGVDTGRKAKSLGMVRHQRSRQGPDHVWPWRSTHGIWSFSKQVQKPPEDCKHSFTEGKATPYLGAPTCPQAVDWLTYMLHLFSECWASSQHRKGPSWDEREKASCRDTLWNANPRARLPPSPGHHCPCQVNLSPQLSLSVLDLCFYHISYWLRKGEKTPPAPLFPNLNPDQAPSSHACDLHQHFRLMEEKQENPFSGLCWTKKKNALALASPNPQASGPTSCGELNQAGTLRTKRGDVQPKVWDTAELSS